MPPAIVKPKVRMSHSKCGYKRRIITPAQAINNVYPEVTLKQFKDFFCVKAFDIISENRYRKFLVKSKVGLTLATNCACANSQKIS